MKAFVCRDSTHKCRLVQSLFRTEVDVSVAPCTAPEAGRVQHKKKKARIARGMA